MSIISSITPDFTVDAGILAGGRGQRMGGQDKGLVLFEGKPMIRHVYDALAPHVQQVWINCNRNQDDYRTISPSLCTDHRQDFSGPLAGIAAILSASSADFILISPCDTPFIRTSYAEHMLSVLVENLSNHHTCNKPLVLAARSADVVHPLHLCLSRLTLPGLISRLKYAELKVFGWLKYLDPVYVDFSEDVLQFRNLNHLSDLN